MADENISEVKEIENAFNTNPPAMSEQSSEETVPLVCVRNAEDVISVVSKDQEECISKANQVPKPQGGRMRRHSTGPQVKSRYHGNHNVSSIHDFCKHGKRCDHHDDAVKLETSSLRKKFEVVKKKPCPSVNSESSKVKEDSEIVRSFNGSSVKANDKARKNRETKTTLSGSVVVKKIPGLRNEKSNIGIEKVSRISNGESYASKNLKSKEKAKTQRISNEDVKEKIVCVVESSVNGVESEKHTSSSEKKTMTSGHNSLTKKKESGSSDIEANPKPEKKIRSKRTGVKETIAKQLTFKRGKILEPKSEDSSPTWIKFRKRVMQEQKTETEESKKNLKEKGWSVEKKTDSSECEKVVLKHRNVEGKKKMVTFFNNVIEETVSKLTKVRKNKVKALIGAFETVISLQDTKTSQKVQSKATTSASKVSPLVSKK